MSKNLYNWVRLSLLTLFDCEGCKIFAKSLGYPSPFLLTTLIVPCSLACYPGTRHGLVGKISANSINSLYVRSHCRRYSLDQTASVLHGSYGFAIIWRGRLCVSAGCLASPPWMLERRLKGFNLQELTLYSLSDRLIERIFSTLFYTSTTAIVVVHGTRAIVSTIGWRCVPPVWHPLWPTPKNK